MTVRVAGWLASAAGIPALAASAVIAVAGCAGPVGAGSAHAAATARPASYYLSLGDSLAQGVQPSPAGASTETGDGYANQLYAALRRTDPDLRLVKLGCPSETTTTMIHGGICRYPGGSQLAAALSFLRAHAGQVSLITIDIGANDPDSCITRPGLAAEAGCAAATVPRTVANLTTILARLRAAADGARMIGMTYYLPELAEWRDGMTGELIARGSELLGTGYNSVLAGLYEAYGVRVADVSGAFHTSDFGNPVLVHGFGSLPRNVAAICQWTWECAPGPRGPNQHANSAGYAVIARAFLLADGR